LGGAETVFPIAAGGSRLQFPQRFAVVVGNDPASFSLPGNSFHFISGEIKMKTKKSGPSCGKKLFA
jgi:hypothetical protein